MVLDRQFHGRHRVAGQPTGRLQCEREACRRTRDPGGAEGLGRQRARSRRDAVGPYDGTERPTARRREPKGVGRVLHGTEDPAARHDEVNDHTGNTVAELIGDFDDRRRNAGRHRAGLGVDGLLEDLRREVHQPRRAERDR